MRDDALDGYLRIRQVTEKLHVSKGKVMSLLRSGRLRALRVDGLVFVERASLEAWLETGRPWVPRQVSPPQRAAAS